jgi:hypothetical protein
MKIDVLKIEDTEDGGAIVSLEVDRDMLHVIAANWFVNTIKYAVNEVIGDSAPPDVSSEEGLAPYPDPEEEEAARESAEFSNTDWKDSFTYPHER